MPPSQLHLRLGQKYKLEVSLDNLARPCTKLKKKEGWGLEPILMVEYLLSMHGLVLHVGRNIVTLFTFMPTAQEKFINNCLDANN